MIIVLAAAAAAVVIVVCSVGLVGFDVHTVTVTTTRAPYSFTSYRMRASLRFFIVASRTFVNVVIAVVVVSIL